MNRSLKQLSNRAHIKIRNQFTGFFAAPETTIWHLYAEHVTHRKFIVELSGNDINELIGAALIRMEELENRVIQKTDALKIVHPDMNEYEIADLLRNMPRYYE
jgi:hypothetical protein